MKLLITVFKKENIKKLLEKASGIIVGNKQYAARLTNSFEINELKEIINEVYTLGKEVFLQANQMFSDMQLESFKAFLELLPLDKLTGVIVADIGATIVLEELGFKDKAIYNPETLNTNYFDFNYLDVFGAYVAKEITLEDIKIISNVKKHKLFMVGHGHLNMFYSKRKLIQNYSNFAEIDNDFEELQTLRIKEQTRDNQYPILADLAGTHVFRSKVFNTFSVLEELKSLVDYLVIDTIFKDDQYALEILNLYVEGYNEVLVENIQTTYEESWDDGFLNFKTYYKKGA